MQEVSTLLLAFGFSIVRVQGSHHIFEYDDGTVVIQLVVPLHGRKVKPLYIKRAIEILDRLIPQQSDSEEDA